MCAREILRVKFKVQYWMDMYSSTSEVAVPCGVYYVRTDERITKMKFCLCEVIVSQCASTTACMLEAAPLALMLLFAATLSCWKIFVRRP